MTGEWGVGTSLVMETVPTKCCGVISGIVQQGYGTVVQRFAFVAGEGAVVGRIRSCSDGDSGTSRGPDQRLKDVMKSCLEALNGRVVAVLNTGSGSCDESSAEQARGVLDRAGVTDAEIVSVGPSELAGSLANAVASADVVVVLGGDGTIATAAGLCSGPSAPYLIPLPGGTMNMLPRSLYGSGTWTEALAAVLASPVEQTVSGGDLAGHRFYCAAILGAPSLWADAREAVREGHLLEAAQRAVTATRRSLSDAVEYDFGTVSDSAQAVAVICPLVSQALSDNERSLEAVALDPATATGLFGLTFHAVFDDWRNDASVTRVKTRNIRVTGHGELPIILDGEKLEIGRSATITFVPVAFRALVPGRPQE